MKLGIFEVGHCNDLMAPKYGLYPPLFQTLLQPHAPALEFQGYRVLEGVLPDDLAACDAWLITGSAHGVYDDLPWIGPLSERIRAAYARSIPMIGVCFGHQLMAHALGGRAEKSDRGWGMGVHRYETLDDPAWFGAQPDLYASHAMHQDQVVAMPAEARLLARSEFCPFAAIAYGPGAETRAISIQSHPEFDAAFEGDLIRSRMAQGAPAEVTGPALDTMGRPVDNAAIAAWFVRFLEHGQVNL